MERLRVYYDADRSEQIIRPTRFKTQQNANEIYCDMCGDGFFIDDVSFEEINKIIEETTENPFICEDCTEEYEELAH